MTAPLNLKDDEIVRVAKRRLGGNHKLAWIVVKQALTENTLKLVKQVSFRSDRNEEAVAAYAAMNAKEFEGINARQQWANWRTVPRNLNGRLPRRPVRVIDLCSGMGHSTDVLAHYVMAGSELHGLEFSEDLVRLARGRSYVHADGSSAKVTFRAQSVLETFRSADGGMITEGNIDLVNCCGAVGHHFDPSLTVRLAREVSRVLKPGGLALIDSGPDGTRPDELRTIFRTLGFRELGSARSCFADRNTQICFSKES